MPGTRPFWSVSAWWEVNPKPNRNSKALGLYWIGLYFILLFILFVFSIFFLWGGGGVVGLGL